MLTDRGSLELNKILLIPDTTPLEGQGECFAAASVRNQGCQVVRALMQRAEDAM